jgi:hypothetical protein
MYILKYTWVIKNVPEMYASCFGTMQYYFSLWSRNHFPHNYAYFQRTYSTGPKVFVCTVNITTHEKVLKDISRYFLT